MSAPVDVTFSLSRVLRSASISKIATTIFALIIVRLIVRAIYRAYFSELCRFPGPKLSAATRIPYLHAVLTGSMPTYVGKLHEHYGDIVRISPDELSIIDPQAWKDVHGHMPKGARGAPPTKHWARYGKPVNGVDSVLNTREDVEHARLRRVFLPAFSDRALKQQEPLFMKYIDLLVQKLNEGIQKDPNGKLDMVRMYNFTTFDVMGDLTFGEPLNMLSNGEYDPWVSLIFGSISSLNKMSIIMHYPIIQKTFNALVPQSIMKKRAEHFRYSVDRVTKRLEQGSDNADIWNLVLSQEEGRKQLSRGEMDSNASLFMIAGTETTATLVSGLTYLLLKTPHAMKKLAEEIRGAFSSSEDMHMEEIAQLPYLNACVKEGLRRYPPVPVGLPRLTPPDGSTVCGQYIPARTTITIPHLAMYHSEKNFKDPYKFVPERWLGDEQYADDNKFALQPFSFGSRDCLGKNMALHEMRLIMVKVLYNFDLELCPESEEWNEQNVFTLWEKHPLMVKLKPAKKS